MSFPWCVGYSSVETCCARPFGSKLKDFVSGKRTCAARPYKVQSFSDFWVFMIAMLRLKAFSLIRFLILGSVLLSLPLRAQDLRKWMPNLGDRFVYAEAWSSSGQQGSGSQPYSNNGRDTLIMEILKIDSVFVGDTSWRVVIVKDTYYNNSSPTSLQSCYFHAGRDSNSTHSLMIDVYEPTSTQGFAYDFSDSRDSQAEYGSKQITVYSFDSSVPVLGLVQTGQHREVAVYSPDLRWFLYQYEESSSYPNIGVSTDDASSTTLLSADLSRVEDSPPVSSEFSVQYQGTSLQILLDIPKPLELALLDPLGRSVRSWQVPIGAGERQIILNVADVPSGVYFLRISAPGVEEMRKVVIVH